MSNPDKKQEEPISDPHQDGPSGVGAPASKASLWSELKHRKVFRVASVYIVTGWIIIQVASSTFENFGIPVWAFRFVALMVLLGLPVAIILTWAFELTPDGIKTTRSARSERDENPAAPGSQKKRNWIAYATGALIPTLIFGALAVFFYFQTRDPDHVATNTDAATAEVAAAGLSIAMMPLINMSSNEENAYFAGGIHEDVLTNLSRINNLRVISRTTMLRQAASDLTLPEIGEALGVDYIVEGSVRRIGNHVRVTVQLIAADNDEHLWASNYERELVDVFATQSELAREIGNAIHLEIQPESVGTLAGMPTTSVLAYDLYLKAISIEKTEDTTEENILEGTTLLEQAVETDPDFVEAWALLKRRYDYMRSRVANRGWFVADDETPMEAIARLTEKAARALTKAITLDPENTETQLSIAVDHVWPQPPEVMVERRQIFDAILDADPENSMARYHLAWWYRHLEPPDDVNSLACFEEALRLDPFNARIVRAVLERYRSLSDEENVARLAERLTEIVPELAEDRQLTSLHPARRTRTFRQAFLATADESLLNDFVAYWEDPLTWQGWDDHRTLDYRIYRGVELGIFTNDLDRAIEISNEWEVGQIRSGYNLSMGIHINFMAMSIHLARGAQAEAEACARRIIELNDQTAGLPGSDDNWDMAHTVIAHVILGDTDEAKTLCESLLQQRKSGFDTNGFAGIAALQYVDLDRAVDLALAEKTTHPTWEGLDRIAAECVINREFVIHPKIREYYLAEGKWVDFLAKRIPEYLDYAKQN